MRDTGGDRQGADAEVPPTAADRTQAFAAEPLLEPVYLPLFANVMAQDVRAGKVNRAFLEMGHEEIKERLARGEEWEQRGTHPPRDDVEPMGQGLLQCNSNQHMRKPSKAHRYILLQELDGSPKAYSAPLPRCIAELWMLNVSRLGSCEHPTLLIIKKVVTVHPLGVA